MRNLVAMKIPKNRQSRMSDDIWLASETIARWFGMSNPRDGFETAVRDYVSRMAESNKEFEKLWAEVKAEGIEND